MRSRTLITLAAILAFLALLTWNTLEAQKVTCEVCVEFNGKQRCATASHENEPEAARSAQATACGPLAQGMNETIACQNRPVLTRQCRNR